MSLVFALDIRQARQGSAHGHSLHSPAATLLGESGVISGSAPRFKNCCRTASAPPPAAMHPPGPGQVVDEAVLI